MFTFARRRKAPDMETGLIHLHSFLRWFALIAIVISLIKSFEGMRRRSIFTSSDDRWSLITLITFHLQLVLGLALYFMRGWYQSLGNMTDPYVRFFSLEHAFGMLIAIILVTIGRISSKKADLDRVKHKRLFWYFLIALIIVLVTIPWPFRPVIGAGRSWFPGM